MMKQKTNLDGLVKRVTCLICGICFCFGIYAQQQKPFVIPELKEWKGETGFFTPKQSVRIICDDPDLQKVARQFAADYKALHGVLPEIAGGKPCEGDFLFTILFSPPLKKKVTWANFSDSAQWNWVFPASERTWAKGFTTCSGAKAMGRCLNLS